MRQIKFRVWNKIGKRMLYDSSLAFKGNAIVEEEGTKVMQFTGLKAKKRKEIYDGDIIKWCNECIFVIKWSDSSAGFYYDIIAQKDENTGYDIRLYRSDESAKIIGNIYENPELLKTSGAKKEL